MHVFLVLKFGTRNNGRCRDAKLPEEGELPRASVRASGATRARRRSTMSLANKRAANPVSSSPKNAAKRPRGEDAKASAGDADAAKPSTNADTGDALGRIFVAVRIRPLNAREREGSREGQATPRFSALDGTRVVETRPVREDDALDAAPTAAPAWEADAVFDENDDNAAVYARTAKSVVDAVLRGVNGTVMAYGQTSSGKTHTMSGTADDPGVMTRAVEDIFAAVAAAGEKRVFDIKASYMEIYNEEIRDLLAPDAPEAARASFHIAGGGGGCETATTASRVKLVNDPRGLTRVIGLEERAVTRVAQIIDLVEEGTRKRSVGRTAMNATSSRSHAVLRISVCSSPNPGHALTGPPLASTLYVVDLAGSERADPNAARSKKQTQLKKEGSNINQSLLTLRLCVQRLAKACASPSDSNEKTSAAKTAEPASVGHVPYRDSKLTRILQPALAGPGRTAVVAAVTPAASHVAETYSTLNFVAVAKSVRMEARVNRAGGAGSKAHDSEALKELRACVAAEEIRRKSLEEEHERALEEMSNVGARLSAAESRAAAATAAAEFAERAAASARERAKAADARAEAAEKERDATAAHAASAASRFMDAKSGSRAETTALREALAALEAEKVKATLAETETRKALEDIAASLAHAQEETARAQAEAMASKEAEDAALSTAARELEAADAARSALETTLRGEVDAEKARCAAMKASLERARGRVVEAEKKEKLAKEETAGMSIRLKSAEAALAEAKEGNKKMGSAEKKQLTREVERRVAVEQALDESERRCVVLDAELTASKESLARAETNAENAVQALEQERSAAKELDEAATMALSEVERLAAETERLEKALASQTARVDEVRVDLEMTREELAETREAAKRGAVSSSDPDARVAADASRADARLLSEELAAARSAARAAAAGEAAAVARAEALESELKSSARRVRDIEADAASRVADAADAAEAASLEARMLKETNEEMMGFVAELERVSKAATAEAEALRAGVAVDRRRTASMTCTRDDAPSSPFSPGLTVKASTAMRASKATAEIAAEAARFRRVEAEEAEGVDPLVVVTAAPETAVREEAPAVASFETAVATTGGSVETPSEQQPKKRGRGRPKKVRTEAEQRFVDLKTKKSGARAQSAGAAVDKENAPGSNASLSLKSLIVAANAAKKKRPALGAAEANGTKRLSAAARDRDEPAAKPKRRRLAPVSSLRDIVGSPLENGRFLR